MPDFAAMTLADLLPFILISFSAQNLTKLLPPIETFAKRA